MNVRDFDTEDDTPNDAPSPFGCNLEPARDSLSSHSPVRLCADKHERPSVKIHVLCCARARINPLDERGVPDRHGNLVQKVSDEHGTVGCGARRTRAM